MNWFFLEKQLLLKGTPEKKDLLLLANNLLDSCNSKERYQSSIGKKNRKSVKQPEIITYEPKTLEISNIFNIYSIIREHLKTLHQLSKTYKTS